MRSLHILLTTYCLRRKQAILHQIVKNITEIVRKLEFTDHEHQNYERIKRGCNNAVRDRLCQVGLQSYGSVFQTIMRLRLFCNLGPVACTSVTNLGDPSRCTYCRGQSDLQELEVLGNNYEAGYSVLLCVSSCPRREMQMGPQESQQAYQYRQLPPPGSPAFIEQHSLDVGTSPQTLSIGRRGYPSKIVSLVEDISNNPQNEKR